MGTEPRNSSFTSADPRARFPGTRPRSPALPCSCCFYASAGSSLETHCPSSIRPHSAAQQLHYPLPGPFRSETWLVLSKESEEKKNPHLRAHVWAHYTCACVRSSPLLMQKRRSLAKKYGRREEGSERTTPSSLSEASITRLANPSGHGGAAGPKVTHTRAPKKRKATEARTMEGRG